MSNIKLTASGGGFTPVPDHFIDTCMRQANGEYIKTYLFLLKSFYAGNTSLTVSGIADCLEQTDNDVIRALRYWEKNNCIRTEIDASGFITRVDFSNSPAPAPKAAPVPEISKDSDEFRELSHSAERYFGRPLRATDINILLNMVNNLNLSCELIDYLLCYAVEKDKKSMRYVEATGIAWLDAGVTTPAKAKEYLKSNNDVVSCVMKAFGLQNRCPATQEMDFIAKWKDNYGFDTDIIIEACNRTMSAINNPSFRYADKILSDWHDKGIKNFDDIKKLDDDFNASVKASKGSYSNKKADKPLTRFHNYEQRKNNNLNDIERRIAEMNTKKYGDT